MLNTNFCKISHQNRIRESRSRLLALWVTVTEWLDRSCRRAFV